MSKGRIMMMAIILRFMETIKKRDDQVKYWVEAHEQEAGKGSALENRKSICIFRYGITR